MLEFLIDVPDQSRYFERLFQLVMHELFHILAFETDNYGTDSEPNSNWITWDSTDLVFEQYTNAKIYQ